MNRIAMNFLPYYVSSTRVSAALQSRLTIFADASAKPTYTSDDIINQITRSWGDGDTLQRMWLSDYGSRLPAITVSYGINTSTPVNFTSLGSAQTFESYGLSLMTSTQVAAAQLAFAVWDSLIPTQFVETGASADIILNYSTNTTAGNTYTSTLTYDTQPKVSLAAQQVWMSTSWESNDDSGMALGNYGFLTMLHEIGHALGLSHPSNYDSNVTANISYATDAVFVQDNRQYTIMSYFGGYNTNQQHWTQDGTSLAYLYPQTPMVYDIAAIQALYGADTQTRTDDTVYGYNTLFASNDKDKYCYDFSVNSQPIMTLWDAGGIDTLDCSEWYSAQIIDLEPGHYSSVCGLTDNLGIAFATLIENAYGGTGNDSITGNTANNLLFGGAGADRLNGHKGADTLWGGLGNDDYFVDNLGDISIETSALTNEIDKVYSAVNYSLPAYVEELKLLGTKNIYGIGNFLDNVLIGNSYANYLAGLVGNDTLTGGAGQDTLLGGMGADVYKFVALTDSGVTMLTRDTINDFTARQGDKLDLSVLDANTLRQGNNAFSSLMLVRGFSGELFVPASLVFDQTTQILYGNVDADFLPDLSLQLLGVHTLSLASIIV